MSTLFLARFVRPVLGSVHRISIHDRPTICDTCVDTPGGDDLGIFRPEHCLGSEIAHDLEEQQIFKKVRFDFKVSMSSAIKLVRIHMLRTSQY